MSYIVFIGGKSCPAEKKPILDRWNDLLELEKDLTDMVNKYTNDREENIIGLYHSFAWIRSADAADENIGLDHFFDRIAKSNNTVYVFPYTGGYVAIESNSSDHRIETVLELVEVNMKMSCLNAMLKHYQENDFHFDSVSRKKEPNV